jgi:hypothetical protein
MNDLIEKLRAYIACEGGDLADIEEAADEIERLRAENANLSRALGKHIRSADAEIDRLSVENVALKAAAALAAQPEPELARLRAENEVLRDSNAAKADRIDRLGETVERLLRALHDIEEEWAGAECGEPVYAQEAYAIGLAKRMYQLAAHSTNAETVSHEAQQPSDSTEVRNAAQPEPVRTQPAFTCGGGGGFTSDPVTAGSNGRIQATQPEPAAAPPVRTLSEQEIDDIYRNSFNGQPDAARKAPPAGRLVFDFARAIEAALKKG